MRCDCGEVRYVPYGETWTCEGCGKRWNTAQIPEEAYRGILLEMRNRRLRLMAVTLLAVAVFALLAIVVSPTILFLAPILLMAWYVIYMPLWRRKLRRRMRELPTWQLTPE